jgi:2-dehydropantoate 2-reductase
MKTSLPKKRRIAVIGIGGIGGYFGTRLLLQYASDPDYEFMFIQRGEHLKKIREQGLKYITQHHEYKVFPNLAVDNPERTGLWDLVIFCVKSYDLEASAESIKPYLHPDAVVISTLNGTEIHVRLQKILPPVSILPGCIYISAQIDEPGVVRQIGGAGQFFFGAVNDSIQKYQDIEDILQEARIKAHLDENINKRIWEKYIFVCPLASLTTLYNEPIGVMGEDKEKQALLFGLIEEIKLITERLGISLSPDLKRSIKERIQQIPYHTKTSMLVDAAAGRRTEMDILTEYVVNKGRELGIPTPLHDDVYAKLLDKCL